VLVAIMYGRCGWSGSPSPPEHNTRPRS
jgi:hypothetical protein